jgi:hypothetical protein
MATIPKQHPATQFVLFDECVAVPNWRDLAEHTQRDAIRLLTQLLISIYKSSPAAEENVNE